VTGSAFLGHGQAGQQYQGKKKQDSFHNAAFVRVGIGLPIATL
jgi:hypothetical protein